MIAALLLAGAVASPAPAPAHASAFDEVVAAERAFAADAAARGFHAAFVTAFAADGVVFDPTPTNARAKHEGKPRAKGDLAWAPAWASVAAAGDLAFTSGPWELRVPGDAATPPATGWFFTAWRRQDGGAWTVAADLGIDAPLAYAPPTEVANASPAPSGGWSAQRPSSGAQARLHVVQAENLLAKAGTTGLGAAVAAVADPEIRVYRSGHAPVAGTDAAAALLAEDTRKVSCTTERVTASASGDLGFAYGTCAPAPGGSDAKPFGYLRVWRHVPGGAWALFVDVTP